MKMAKKLLAIVLVLSMVLSAGVTAFAASFGTYSLATYGMDVTYTCRVIAAEGPNGPCFVACPMGADNSVLQIIDIATGKLLKSWNVDTGDTFWYGLVQYADHTKVHVISGLNTYIVDTDALTYTKVSGTMPSGFTSNGIAGGGNGYYYGIGSKTYNGSIRVYRYNESTAYSQFATIPNITSGGGMAYVNGYLYTGGVVSSGTTSLYKVDPSTGAVTSVGAPAGVSATSFSYMAQVGNYVMVSVAGDGIVENGYLYDTVNNKWLTNNFNYTPNGAREEIDGVVYFLSNGTFKGINTTTLEITDTGAGTGASYFRGSGISFTYSDFGSNKCFLQCGYNGEIMVVCPALGQTKQISTELKGARARRRISRTTRDGHILEAAYMGSQAQDYSIQANTVEKLSLGQAEGAVTYGSKVYFGVYPGAEIWCYDTTKEPVVRSNPYKAYDIGDDQDRPFGMDIMGDKLLVGTLPSANVRSGGFTVIDLKTGEMSTYRAGTDFAEAGYSVTSITHDEAGYAYLGLTCSSGVGATPASGNAAVIKWNVASGKQVGYNYLTGLGGYNPKAVHMVRISPYDGMLYGMCAGILFKMDTSLTLKSTNVYNSSIIESDVSSSIQIWHEHYAEFYDGYLFVRNMMVDPSTLSVVSSISSVGQIGNGNDGTQFAGIYDDKAYYLTSTGDAYAAPINKTDVVTEFPYQLTWNAFETNEAPYQIEGSAPAYIAAGRAGTIADPALQLYAGSGTGMNASQALDTTAPGISFKLPTHFGGGGMYTSMDFYVENENVEAILWAPISTEGNYLMPVKLGANGRVYLVGKHNIEYEVGTVNYGAWNRLSATYANSSGGTVITPYLNGVNTGAVHSQYALGDFEAFDVRIAARTTAAEYAAKPTYEARGEYIKIDNVKMSPYSSALSEGTMITGIEQVDSKTLEVSFSATPPTLDGTAILLNGSTATTVASSSVTDNVATLTLAADLAPFTTYSYQPSGVLEAVYFTTGATYRANFDGTAADSATNGDTLVYSLSRASTISNNQLNMWAGYGGTAAYYNESADHDHGETVSITTPATINDATVVWAFDYNKNFDTVTRIVPRFSGQARYTFAPCFDIHANGDIYAVSTSEGDRKIAQIEPNTTNRLAMKITVSSSRNIMTTFYVNGVNCGTFTNNSAEFKAGLTGFTFYNTAYTSAEGNVLSPGRSDGRMENCLVDNMILTSDLSEVDYPLMASTVKAVDINTMRFETNLACTAPIAGDCLITDPAGAELTVTGVKKVSDTSFDVTVSEKLTANAVYDYDIFCGDEEIMGSFTAKLADRINYFNTSNGMPEYYSSAGTSKQQSVRVGKFGGSDKAFVWSPNENANGGIGAAAIHRDAAQLVWDVPAANLNKDKFVASTDFMIGSERVAAWVLSLTGSHYRHALANVSVDTAGTVDFAGTTIATIKPMEWHNVTLNVLVVSGGLVVDVYFDGVLKAENILVGNSNNAGITAIKTIAATDTPTDTAVAALANTDPGRYDVIALDNMYIGNDLTYKTSDIVLTASGNDVAASTGIIDRSDVGVTALYDSTGVIKNLKMTAFNAAKFSDVTVSGALSIDGAASGDIVKFFVVNDMLNITPLSNVVSATK